MTLLIKLTIVTEICAIQAQIPQIAYLIARQIVRLDSVESLSNAW